MPDNRMEDTESSNDDEEEDDDESSDDHEDDNLPAAISSEEQEAPTPGPSTSNVGIYGVRLMGFSHLHGFNPTVEGQRKAASRFQKGGGQP